MNKKLLFSLMFPFVFLFLFAGGWLTTDIRLDTGDTPGASYSSGVQIDSSGDNVYAVWYDKRNGWNDIYFNYSSDGGATWQASDIRLDTGDTPGANFSWTPQISSSGSNVYAVWPDERNVNNGLIGDHSGK